jgi:hypothetical protein
MFASDKKAINRSLYICLLSGKGCITAKTYPADRGMELATNGMKLSANGRNLADAGTA